MVDYAVTVLVDGAGVSNAQLDYLTLQSNRVENSYRTLAGRPTAVHATSSFATEELKNTDPRTGTMATVRLFGGHIIKKPHPKSGSFLLNPAVTFRNFIFILRGC